MTEEPERAPARGAADLPLGMLRRSARLAGIPARHALHTAAAATRLSRTASADVKALTAGQMFTTLGELKGGAAKLGQALSVMEAVLPEEVAGPYRAALRALTDSVPPMPFATVARVLAEDLAGDPRLVDVQEVPAASASIGQVHRAVWVDERGRRIPVAVKVQYPGVAKAIVQDMRSARWLTGFFSRLARVDVGDMVAELAARVVEETDYPREARIQTAARAAFTRALPAALHAAVADGVQPPPGRTQIVVPAVRLAAPRVLVTDWLDGIPLTRLLDVLLVEGPDSPRPGGHERDRAGGAPAAGRGAQLDAGALAGLPPGWRELGLPAAVDRAGRLLAHAVYAPAACAGWMHADLHPGNFLLLPSGRLGVLDWGAAAELPEGIPVPFGLLAAAVLRGDAQLARARAEAAGVLPPGSRLPAEALLSWMSPIVDPVRTPSFTYSRAWMRAMAARMSEPRQLALSRALRPPARYALVWRAVVSLTGLLSQLGATVGMYGFELAYSPGFRVGLLESAPGGPGSEAARGDLP